MEINFQILFIAGLFVCIALMVTSAIILAIMNWITAQRTLLLLADIPKNLAVPLTAEERRMMRSWYANHNEPYIQKIALDFDPIPQKREMEYSGQFFRPNMRADPSLTSSRYPNTWKPSSKAIWAMNNPDASIKQADSLMFQVAEAIKFCEENEETKETSKNLLSGLGKK